MKIFYTDHYVLPLPAEHRIPMRKYALLRARVEEEGLAGADGLQVVPIEGDVELPERHRDALGALDQLADPLGQLDAPALDADQQKALRSMAPLDDFNGHSRQGACDGSFIEQRRT